MEGIRVGGEEEGGGGGTENLLELCYEGKKSWN